MLPAIQTNPYKSPPANNTKNANCNNKVIRHFLTVFTHYN